MNYLKQIQQLADDVTSNQDELFKLIDRLYQDENPFPPNRDDDTENFTDDVNKIQEIIAYSILTSNPNLFEQWVINPLHERKLNLVRTNYIEDYIDEFRNPDYDYVKNIDNEFQKSLVDRFVSYLESY